MLWRDNEGENRPDVETGTVEPPKDPKKIAEKLAKSDTMTREELLASSPEARAVYERIKELRKSVDAMSVEEVIQEPKEQSAKDAKTADGSQVQAAEEAVKRRAMAEANRIKQQSEEAKKKELYRRQQVLAAQRRAEQKVKEAEQKRKEAEEASKLAREASLKKALQDVDASRKARAAVAEQHERLERTVELKEALDSKMEKESKELYEKTVEAFHDDTMDALKEELLSTQYRQEAILGKISDIADRSTMRLTANQQKQIQELSAAQLKAKEERDRQRKDLKTQLEKTRAERIQREQAARSKKAEAKAREIEEKRLKKEAAAKAAEEKRQRAIREAAAKREKAEREAAAKKERAEREAAAKRERAEREAAAKRAKAQAIAKAKAEKHARELAAKQARIEEENRIKAERQAEARKLWKERRDKQQEARKKKALEKQKLQAEKLRLKAEHERLKIARKRELDEIARLEQIREADAAMGGGILNVHDMTIRTAIDKTATFSLRDLLGLKTKEEKRAKTEEERAMLALDREIRMENARAGFSFNRMLKANSFRNSKLGRKLHQILAYCDSNKRKLITVVSAVVLFAVIIASGLNYCTAYEYSYNGTTLGVVKSKDDVLRITDVAQSAVAKDTNMDIIIDAKDDISFRRVWAMGNVDIDDTDAVLERLTYMSDFKVASYGIYVDGKKAGALPSSEEVQNVLQKLKDQYLFKGGEGEVKEAVFLEKVEVKECNTKLQNVYSEDEMLNLLTADRQKETVHNVVAGETLKDIATTYQITVDKLLKDNTNLTEDQELSAGTPVVIKDVAPLVTVRITEKVSYEETIKYETETTKSKDMYEGDSEVTQEGENGKRAVTANIVTVNGKEIERDSVSEKVIKKAVTKKVTVGTAERPPTVGDGKFAWPLKCNFRKTSPFGYRWGRLHKGVDLACATGNTVYAADGGTVVTASYKPSYGNLVEIDHQNGYLTKYAHNSKILVKVGDKVYEGQPIALVGSTGNSTGPHCHFEIRWHGEPKDPMNYLPAR